jgi:NADPH:quinone reductase-like Zn-dependent oxidoreductase
VLAAYATGAGGENPLANLEVGEREIPDPQRGFVRLAVSAATLNHHDLWTLQGVGVAPSTYPRTLGCDVAGRVESYGPDTKQTLPVGTEAVAHAVITCGVCDACLGPDETLCRRFALLTEGSYEGTLAEYCLVPAQNLFPLPAGLSPEEAACLPTVYLTAYRMLFNKGGLRPGGTVMIQGAGGGLSTAAEVLALAAGLRVVVSSRSAAKREAALGRGVHHAVATGPEAVSEVLSLTAGDGVDVVIGVGGGGDLGDQPEGAASGGRDRDRGGHQRGRPARRFAPGLLAPAAGAGLHDGNQGRVPIPAPDDGVRSDSAPDRLGSPTRGCGRGVLATGGGRGRRQAGGEGQLSFDQCGRRRRRALGWGRRRSPARSR